MERYASGLRLIVNVSSLLQEWQEQGVFQMAWAECLARYDQEFGIDWSKLNIDSSQAKAPLGGKKNRQKPCGQRKNRN
jgi:hypothetical protein